MKFFLISASILLYLSSCFGESTWSPANTLSLYSQTFPFACTKLVNKDGPIGCTSSRTGDTGMLWYLDTQDDVDSYIAKPPSFNRILVMSSTVFNRVNVEALIQVKKVKGIMVAPGPPPASGFSPASKFPQKQYGLHSDSDYEWNPLGDDFAFQYYTIPMFALDPTSTDTTLIVERAMHNRNGSFPQWGATLNSWMHSSKDAEACLRRGQCEPLGGKNVYSVFEGGIQTGKPVIIAQAGYDTNSFFHDESPGATANSASVVALMLAADALSKVDRSSFTKQLAFLFYTGEAYGYLGSKRFVNDIKTGDFPNITMDQISSIVELNQIGSFGISEGAYAAYAHKERTGQPNPIYDLAFNTSTDGIQMNVADADTPGIPPSSLMAFLKETPTLPSVVITNHAGPYINKYYHSRFDDFYNVKQDHVCKIANLTARLLYAAATGSSVIPNMQINCTLGVYLLVCFTENMSCNLSDTYLYGYDVTPTPSHYTSVWRSNAILTPITGFIRNFMAAATVVRTGFNCLNDDACLYLGGGFCVGGTCVASATGYRNAYSLAIDANKERTDLWDTESTWMESNWGGINVELFAMENPNAEIVIFLFGLLNLVASFAIVWWLSGYLTKRFKST